MMLQVTLQDAQRETAVLARRLGLAARENEELAMSASETQPSLAGKVGQDRGYLDMSTCVQVVYDLEDPARPRFTLAELKDILQERNSLKVGRLPVCNLCSVTLFTPDKQIKEIIVSSPGYHRNKEASMGWSFSFTKDSFCHQKPFAPFILYLRNSKHVFDEQFSDNFP